MSHQRKRVEEAIRAIVVHSPTSYSWFGKRSPRLSPRVKQSFTPKTARSYLLFNMQSQLYENFYCRGFPVPSGQAEGTFTLVGEASFVEELSAANCGTGYWEDGWEIRAVKLDEVIVHRRDLELWLRPKDWRIPQGSQGYSIAPGLQLSLRFPKEFLGISPGFYMARGNERLPDDGSQVIVRFYWNLTPVGALRFMEQATFMLNRAELPFSLKILNNPHHYSRCDAVVLYVRKSDYHAVAGILEEIGQKVVIYLKQEIPAFTKQLMPGIGFAEDPGQNLSFGEHRCRLLAEGIIRAYEQGRKSLEERFQTVAERFAEDGVNLEKPFLNPGSGDHYQFRPPRPKKSHGSEPTPGSDFNADVLLRSAVLIARRLSREAVWHGDRCNWLGAMPMSFGYASRRPDVRYCALGPWLYDGTGGVALFLAELHAATGDVAARCTALGAITQALSHVETLAAPDQIGLYTGATGVAFAAARVGTILSSDKLLERAAEVLHNLTWEKRQEQEFDLLSGAAGAIAALVILKDILHDMSLVDFAVRLGDYLLVIADKADVGYSWGLPGFPGQRNLTGFSHGAAGVGYALLELFRVTGEPKYRIGAERAFDYERHWFDPEAGNWPDFREELGQARRSNAPRSFATFWCHGAPGIALSRLRAFQILNDSTYKAEAIAALRTTRTTIQKWLQSRSENYSLCHGLAGNAAVLLHGCQVLGQELAEDRKLVAEVANAGFEMYAKHGGEWPCGTGGEETPNLMLGLAGIGHFYLRLYAPKVPSVLILQSESS